LYYLPVPLLSFLDHLRQAELLERAPPGRLAQVAAAPVVAEYFRQAGAKTGLVVGAKAVAGDEDLVLITEKGVVNRVGVADISKQGRATQGVKVMKVEAGNRVAAMAVVKEEEESE